VIGASKQEMAFQLQAGDEIELVEYVADPNGAQIYYSRAQDFHLNVDGVNHVWAIDLPQFYCSSSQTGPCVYVGFEDKPCRRAAISITTTSRRDCME
jgi:hypothetical protein